MASFVITGDLRWQHSKTERTGLKHNGLTCIRMGSHKKRKRPMWWYNTVYLHRRFTL